MTAYEPITEDPMKSLIREVMATGDTKDEFKHKVRKHLIKTTPDKTFAQRTVTSKRIKEAHKRIDTYWKEIEAE